LNQRIASKPSMALSVTMSTAGQSPSTSSPHPISDTPFRISVSKLSSSSLDPDANPAADPSTAAPNETPISERFKMLLGNDPISLRKLTHYNRDRDIGDGPMLDGGPRGRSPIALRKQQVNESLNRGRGTTHKKLKEARAARSKTRAQAKKHKSRSPSRARLVKVLDAYPPYVVIPELFKPRSRNLPSQAKKRNPRGRMEMIKGSTCKLIMQLWTEYKNADKVISLMMLPNPLAGTQWEDTEDQDTSMGTGSEADDEDDVQVDTIKWHLAKDDVEAIVEHCGHVDLTGDKAMLVDIQQWQSYVPDKWWTVDDKVAGRDDPIKSGEEGFWSKVRSSCALSQKMVADKCTDREQKESRLGALAFTEYRPPGTWSEEDRSRCWRWRVGVG
jgi:hypothetical protein